MSNSAMMAGEARVSHPTDWSKTSDGYYSMEPVVLNRRRRFWRWLLGYTQPLFTREQMNEAKDIAAKSIYASEKREEPIGGSKRFQIIDAVNGKIVRFTSADGDVRLGGSRPNNGVGSEQYYVVKEGEPLLDAIARLIATDRIEQK